MANQDRLQRINSAIKNGTLRTPFKPSDIQLILTELSVNTCSKLLSDYSYENNKGNPKIFNKIKPGQYEFMPTANFLQDNPNNESTKDKDIGKIRDGIIIFTTGLYITGYLVWAIHAWKYGLGLLPLLDTQYFVAGLIPLFLVLLFVYYRKAIKYLKPRLLEKSKKIWVAIVLLLLLTLVLQTGILVLVSKNSIDIRDHAFLGLSVFALLAAFILEGISSNKSEYRGYLNFAIPLTISIFSIFIFYYYVTVIFPQIPYELGGPGTRCATLYISGSSLSGDVEKLLAVNLPPPQNPSTSAVLQSTEVQVLFRGSDYWLIRLPSDTHIIEIASDGIKTIYWCEKK